MCNARGFLCCASDVFEGCGCDGCPEPDCHACALCGERDCDGECAGADDYDFDDDEIAREGVPLAFVREDGAGPHEPPLAPSTPGRAA